MNNDNTNKNNFADLKKELNNVQFDAATNFNGASLIIAGAGSGKTRVLTYRIAYMISQGVLPHNILALTFTNKAAAEMRERIKSVVGWENARFVRMGTFHSIFSRILRNEPEATGFPANYTIYDTTDSKSLIKSIVKELDYDEKVYKPTIILARISMAKNALVTPAIYASNAEYMKDDMLAKRPYTADIYRLYWEKCKRANAMDFDDLLLRTNILFRDHHEVLAKYQDLFKYILVDEYQDTNFSQYLIIKKLAAAHGNICVVGDDAQSIYAFRGARIENILNFQKDYPNCREFKLEQNYRSTQTIVNAANSVIKHNSQQLKKDCFSEGETGEKIHVIKAYTDKEESIMVVSNILKTKKEYNAAYSDFAVLYRTNAQSRIFEDALRQQNVPYKIYGSISFYQRAEVKNMLAYLRMCVNHNDDEAFKRIINYPTRGIGDTTIEHLQNAADAASKSLFDTIESENLITSGIKTAAATKLKNFTTFINEYTAKALTDDAFDFAQQMSTASGILADLHQEQSTDGESKVQNIESLLNGIKEFCDSRKEEAESEDMAAQTTTIAQFLENVALITDSDNEKEEDKNKVTLMTVHQAKGLEYNFVYIAGMEENLFPGSSSNISLQELEEERRLFYVALTRAKIRAGVSFAQSRLKWGDIANNKPSRFLREINREFLDDDIDIVQPQINFDNNDDDFDSENNFEKRTYTPKSNTTIIVKRPQMEQRKISENFTPANPEDIRIGMRVEHSRFGCGKVISVEGDMLENRKAIVVFDDCGTKTLLLKFAKFMILQ